MKNRALLIVVFVMCVALFAGAGCSKKRVESAPSAADQSKIAVKDDDARRRAEEERLAAERAREAERQRLLKLQQEMSAMIYFDFDKFELKAESKKLLQAKAEMLKANPKVMVIIEGHCDERGTQEYNMALGQKRAKAAYDFLMQLGISGDRMKTVSFGKEKPLDPANNEAAWAKNRRDEFKINM